MHSKLKVVIAIPTYRRPDRLRSQLRALTQQSKPLREKVEVHVIDNGGSEATEIESEIRGSGLHFKLTRNEANVGITQNISRCIEFSVSEYVVWLSDDDEINECYLETIFDDIAHLEKKPEMIGVNHSTTLSAQSESYMVASIDELLSKRRDLADFLFISNWVIRRSAYMRYLALVNISASGGFAIIAPLLKGLSEGGCIELSCRPLFIYKPTPIEKKWSWFKFLQGAHTLFELPLGLSMDTFSRLRRTAISFGDINLSYIYYSLLAQTGGKITPDQQWIFRKIAFAYHGLWQHQRLPGWVLLIGLRCPRSRYLVDLLHRLSRSRVKGQATSSFEGSL
jgi:glycosyltransferase involved in cell wall biosynthesis